MGPGFLDSVSLQMVQTMNVWVRRATEGDYEQIIDLYEEGDRFHARALPDLFRLPEGQSRPREFVVGTVDDEDAALLVAESQGRLVGVLRAVVRTAPDHPILRPRSFIEISDVVVGESFRGRGVGTQLMGEAHRWAAEKGFTSVELNVYEFNEGARRLYEELGYKTFSRRMRKHLG